MKFDFGIWKLGLRYDYPWETKWPHHPARLEFLAYFQLLDDLGPPLYELTYTPFKEKGES